MKRPRWLWGTPVLIMAGACAMLQPVRHPAERDAEVRLDQGLAALEAGNYGSAYDDLAWVSSVCSGREAGARALVALAALEIDPRNPVRRPAVGSELLGQVIRASGTPSWARPLAESTYLLALRVGAPPATLEATPVQPVPEAEAVADTGDAAEDLPDATDEAGREAYLETEPVYGCGRSVEREDWAPPALPRMSGPSLTAVVGSLEVERDSAAARAASLAEQLAATQARLEETERELERIRQTLKP